MFASSPAHLSLLFPFVELMLRSVGKRVGFRLETSWCLSKGELSPLSEIGRLLCVPEERRAAGFVPTTGFGFGLVGPLSFDAVYPEVAEETTDSASYRETISEIDSLLGDVWRLSGA